MRGIGADAGGRGPLHPQDSSAGGGILLITKSGWALSLTRKLKSPRSIGSTLMSLLNRDEAIKFASDYQFLCGRTVVLDGESLIVDYIDVQPSSVGGFVSLVHFVNPNEWDLVIDLSLFLDKNKDFILPI